MNKATLATIEDLIETRKAAESCEGMLLGLSVGFADDKEAYAACALLRDRLNARIAALTFELEKVIQ